MEHADHDTTEGTKEGLTGARVIELARRARLARRTAAEFMRRWAVEQAVEEVGLVALRSGAIDLPSQRIAGERVESEQGI